MAANDAPRFVEAVVASGRTVVDATGASIKPGHKAKLHAGEVKRLRAQGFLLESDEELADAPPGPNIKASDGPTVRKLA
jgi:hypothetical protein